MRFHIWLMWLAIIQSLLWQGMLMFVLFTGAVGLHIAVSAGCSPEGVESVLVVAHVA